MEWILLIVIAVNGTVVATAKFDTPEQCKAALNKIIPTSEVRTVCVPLRAYPGGKQ